MFKTRDLAVENPNFRRSSHSLLESLEMTIVTVSVKIYIFNIPEHLVMV